MKQRYEEVKLPPMELPPMENEPNQAEIDKAAAEQLQQQAKDGKK